MLRMDNIDDDFSYYLDNYKDQFIAEGVNSNQRNKSLLENAKTQINSFLSQLTIEKQKLISQNENLERKIRKRSQTIELAKKKNGKLESEKDRLENSDLGAIKQNQNFMRVYSREFLQTIMKVCLIVLIFIFLYIKDDVFQAIRSRVPTKIKTI
tara:strand:+ start:1098 stop:1559 length:462 start_codon:yes stop_codon:yes gene_type:complete